MWVYTTVDTEVREGRKRKRKSSQRSVIAILRLIFAGYDCNLRKFNLKPLGLKLSAALRYTQITTLVVLLLMERVIGAEWEVMMKLDALPYKSLSVFSYKSLEFYKHRETL